MKTTTVFALIMLLATASFSFAASTAVFGQFSQLPPPPTTSVQQGQGDDGSIKGKTFLQIHKKIVELMPEEMVVSSLKLLE